MQSALWERLRDFDAYPKPLEDFRIKTLGGGTVTIISTICMCFLFMSELMDFCTPRIQEELFVDSSRSHKLRINIDIVFPKVSCSYLSMDIMDSSGEQQTSFDHNIFKKSLDSKGNPKEETATAVILNEHKKEGKGDGDGHGHDHGEKEGEGQQSSTSTTESTAIEKKGCGSCYGAESKHYKCCNTCEEVREAYRLKGWALKNPQEIVQCASMAKELKNVFDEGCQLYGYLEVNKVSGSFHIAPGKSFSLNHVHVHDVQPFSSSQFNMTHRIQSLTFGENIPGKTNPFTPEYNNLHHLYWVCLQNLLSSSATELYSYFF
ncbi:unnamed protein product [Allacma fusca]|uniref:Endoplasmic reticulum-Golgi intermediate compartment protein 3 n=1 Tax=Allacma fusca TaxID=39272 RepID=A0A8J2PF82_9HEXA|nr:unnamed protein product [Allacma fusca]